MSARKSKDGKKSKALAVPVKLTEEQVCVRDETLRLLREGANAADTPLARLAAEREPEAERERLEYCEQPVTGSTPPNMSKSGPMMAYKFEGGTGSLPAIEVERQLQSQHHAMSNSDHPELRAAGRKQLLDTAKRAIRGNQAHAAVVKKRKAHNPHLDLWIDHQLKKDPSKTDRELFDLVPEDGGKVYRDGDKICQQGKRLPLTFGGFKSRVNAARKRLGLSKRC